MENRDEFRDNQSFGTTPTALPNATAVLVLGITSIVFCFCYGVVGIVCGIVSLVLYSKDKKLYLLNPQTYTPASYSNLKAGRVCALIGLIISAIYFVILISIVMFFGIAFLSNPQHVLDQLR